MPQDFIVRQVVKTVSELPGFPKLSVLDLSCGEGEILSALAQAGCTVQGTRYREGDYIILVDRATSQVPIKNGVNLHEPLPFPDAHFDVVIITEVIEHLLTFVPVLYEIGRVLKPGGYSIVTTPNIHRLHSRWNFFLTGAHKLINRRIGWDQGRNDLYAYHITPADLPFLHTVMHLAGLNFRKLLFTRIKWRHALWQLFYPLFALCAALEFRQGKKGEARRKGEDELRALMRSPQVLYSEQLFIISTKGALKS